MNTKKSEQIATFASNFGQCIASDLETRRLHIVRSTQGSWMEKKLFDMVNKFNHVEDEPETTIYNRAYVDRLFRDGMNEY